MKLEPELIRDILTWAEENLSINTVILAKNVKLNSYSSEQIIYHATLLVEAGYLDGKNLNSHDSRDVILYRLTLYGHELLATMRSDTTWKHTKELLGKIGLVALPEIIKYLLPFISN